MAKSKVNFPVILIKCTDENLIITTMCSFFKPKLSLDNMDLIDCMSLLDSWIHSKKVIVFRCTSEDDITPYDFTDYSIPEKCDGKKLLMKTGFILFHCDDVSKIAWERDKLIMENIGKTGTRLTSKAKRSLCYPTMVPRPAGYTLDDEDENGSDVLTDLSQSQPQPSKKRTYAELEKENMELHSNIQKLENDVDKLAKECAEYEDKKADVEEELEKLKREQPIALIEKMKEHVLDLGHILKNSAALQASNILSPTASFAGSPVHLNRAVNSDKVFLFKEVLISESSLRKAKVALKTDDNSNKSRNNGIAIIMDALYQPEELANMSLSGNACPSMPGSKPKPAIPKEILNEIIGFMVRYWDQAYKGSILTEQQVKEAVSAKLMAVHTREKKQKKKMLANEASSPLTAGATNTATVPITTTASITATDV